MMKKVSVIVPVYNAEEYLGYCINSILSQTYINIELILVNDGSIDGSLQICKNYASIDSRVKVIDIINGGVGNARNVGIDCAEGDYLQFVDSDDVISSIMIETLVNSIELYNKDIVFCGMNLVTLKDNKPEEIRYCTCEGIGKECVLNRDVFLKNFSYLLWKTAMLEGPCNRLYKTNIIKENHLRFPKGISLGEDFLFNLKYYEMCNGAIFLSQKLYYYLQVREQALTKIYRSDLFNNQMMLMEELESFLQRNVIISERERTCIAEYTVAKVLQCFQNLFRSDINLTKDEIKSQIADIFNNERVQLAFQNSLYIDEKYKWLKDAYVFSDVEFTYSRFKEMISEDERSVENVDGRTPGIVNKCCVWGINKILKIHNIRSLEMVRNTLIDYGLKTALFKCLFYYKKKA